MSEMLTIVHSRFYNPDNGYTVLSVRGNGNNPNGVFCAICNSPFQLEKGMVIAVHEGKWVDNTKYGKQYKIESFGMPEPDTREGVERYLASGVIRGIGPAMAKRIVARFGENTLAILDEDPKKLLSVPGIGEATIIRIAGSWNEKRATAKILAALCNLGLSLAYANKVHKHFGDKSVETLKKNPYILTDVYGIGFIRADEIARKLFFDVNDPHRIEAGIAYTLKTAAEAGHCYLPETELLEKAQKYLSVARELVLASLADMLSSSKIIRQREHVYLPHLYQAEAYCRKRITELAYGKPIRLATASTAEESFLTEEQRAAVICAVENPVTVITGLPGTGKTTVTKALIGMLEQLGKSYALCTPTGKASKRLEQLTGQEAKTIHRLLEYHPHFGFQRNEENPLAYDYLIIDEGSMVDILLLQSLLSAVPARSRIVFIGDVNQLPSVGPGNVLKDLIRSKMCPVKQLTEIHRQAEGSSIIQAAHLINKGVIPHLNSDFDRDALVLLENDAEQIKTLIAEAIKSSGFPPEELQILTPTKKGVLGSAELNRALQPVLNRHARDNTSGLKGYYKGDRVIHLVNNYDKLLFNGEVGYVTSVDIENKTLTVAYDQKSVLYEEDELDEISLAYAMTVHKSQGSQFPCVILVLHGTHFIMLRRQLLYTAVTRAEKQLIVIGAGKSIAMAVKNSQEALRYSSLFPRL